MADKRDLPPADQIARLKQLCADLDVIRKKATETCKLATKEIRAAHTGSHHRAIANSSGRGPRTRAGSRKKR
jgi:hypothetical protein